MYYDPTKINQMIQDSGMKIEDIIARTGLSRQTFYDLRKPENAHRLTLDKILKLATAMKLNALDYFKLPEQELYSMKSQLMAVEEEQGTYGVAEMSKVRQLIEDVLLRVDKFRDDYIQSLKYNISIQEEMIEMQREKITSLNS